MTAALACDIATLAIGTGLAAVLAAPPVVGAAAPRRLPEPSRED